MKNSLKAILQKLEKIEENQTGQLQGGFSSLNVSGSVDNTNRGIFNKNCQVCGNNCGGGVNCAYGCAPKIP